MKVINLWWEDRKIFKCSTCSNY